MNKIIKILAIIYAITWLSWQLYTLDKNPLPWYDDTYFASVSNSLLKSGHLIPTVVYSINDHQSVYHYGPLYFIFGAITFKLFGFGVFQFRLVNFLFGLYVLYLTYLITLRLTGKWQLALITIFLFSLDPFMNLCLHEGRMDIMVCSLILTAFYIHWKKENKWNFYLSAFLVGIGILTTSRAIFYVPAFAFYFILQKESYSSIFQWLVLASLPLFIWLAVSFGSIDHLLAYMHHKNSQESVGYFFNLHWPLYIPIHSIYLIVLCIIVFIPTFFIKPDALLNKTFVFLISTIVTYYIVVVDYGPYSVMILPFYYCLFAYLVSGLGHWFPVLSFSTLFVFNAGYVGLKSLQVLESLEMRNPTGLEQKLKTLIPQNSKVVGDAVLFYVVEGNGFSFQYIDHFGNDISFREKKLMDDFDFDYLILTDQYKQRSRSDAEYLIRSGRYKEIDRYEVEQNKNFGFPFMSRLSDLENATGYNCTIYKRIK